jgi:hypothetical protein
VPGGPRKKISSNSAPEQLVGSLADRTPEAQSYPNIHHMRFLQGELSRQFDLKRVHHRPAVDGGEPVELGDREASSFDVAKKRRRWQGGPIAIFLKSSETSRRNGADQRRASISTRW